MFIGNWKCFSVHWQTLLNGSGNVHSILKTPSCSVNCSGFTNEQISLKMWKVRSSLILLWQFGFSSGYVLSSVRNNSFFWYRIWFITTRVGVFWLRWTLFPVRITAMTELVESKFVESHFICYTSFGSAILTLTCCRSQINIFNMSPSKINESHLDTEVS